MDIESKSQTESLLPSSRWDNIKTTIEQSSSKFWGMQLVLILLLMWGSLDFAERVRKSVTPSSATELYTGFYRTEIAVLQSSPHELILRTYHHEEDWSISGHQTFNLANQGDLQGERLSDLGLRISGTGIHVSGYANGLKFIWEFTLGSEVRWLPEPVKMVPESRPKNNCLIIHFSMLMFNNLLIHFITEVLYLWGKIKVHGPEILNDSSRDSSGYSNLKTVYSAQLLWRVFHCLFICAFFFLRHSISDLGNSESIFWVLGLLDFVQALLFTQ